MTGPKDHSVAFMNPEQFIKDVKLEARRIIRDYTAVAGASGGGDSTVAIYLTALSGVTTKAILVDNGYMREGEVGRVERLYNRQPLNSLDNLEFEVVDASDEFYTRMTGVTDPEKKRKVIGRTFIDVFSRRAEEIGAVYLIQGTIAPDWIESGGGLRDNIKSHHNVGGLPDSHIFQNPDGSSRIYEPMINLYKDEVRKLMKYLNIELETIQPFPGPGLAIRTLGEANKKRTAITRKACVVVEDELEKAAAAGEMELPWQYFAVLLPTKSVGVHGDLRAYGETVAIRAVGSLDGMTANYVQIPHEVLDRISRRITNELNGGVNRVVYDVTHKPPGTIEWE